MGAAEDVERLLEIAVVGERAAVGCEQRLVARVGDGGLLQHGDGLRAQAVAVLEQATIANPGNKALLAAYGRALADNGNFKQAFDVLGRAHSDRKSVV